MLTPLLCVTSKARSCGCSPTRAEGYRETPPTMGAPLLLSAVVKIGNDVAFVWNRLKRLTVMHSPAFARSTSGSVGTVVGSCVPVLFVGTYTSAFDRFVIWLRLFEFNSNGL